MPGPEAQIYCGGSHGDQDDAELADEAQPSQKRRILLPRD
jgi:hypothetical protein